MTNLIEREPNDPKRAEINPLLKLALELGPLAIFFFANSRFGIFTATAVFMVAITIALAASWALTRKLAIMPLITGIVVLVFGGLTIYLHNDLFIKLKPTIVNCLFGTILLGGLYFGKSLLGYVFDSVFKLTDEGWRLLTFRWGVFFFVLAIINEIVWRNFSTDFWVSFKLFGFMPITLAFTLFQMPLITKHSIPEEEDRGS
ncbi:septation protein A [Pararhizobium sp. IMCC21322]|uniref:septation protein A n=1 Tax=Pararhizobium sp. IMCC21322 TaxID=3067903 RepID=UPI002741DBCB|nr:septation protein A [Pararhizobium sp. IMCC21322]